MGGIGVLFELIDFVGHSIEAGFGWRYLLSSSYRAKVHARWRSESRASVAVDIFTFGLSFAFITALSVGIVYSLIASRSGS
jgi:hypothetical protein